MSFTDTCYTFFFPYVVVSLRSRDNFLLCRANNTKALLQGWVVISRSNEESIEYRSIDKGTKPDLTFHFAIADSHGYKGLNEIKKLLGDIF